MCALWASRGEIYGKAEWLLARELLCHCCGVKLVGITVQAAAVTRAVHSNHTQKENKKHALGMQMWCASTSDLIHSAAGSCLLLPQTAV